MKKKVLTVVGPTASGKTKTAVRLAQEFNGEVISCDSMQIYRGMNIGTAKPAVEEMCGIPHHLIDIINPTDTFTLHDYLLRAADVVEDIISRGKLPIFAGGTGLYISSFTDNLCLTETTVDDEYREHLNKVSEEKGAEYLLEKLREIDPETAEKLHANNKKRVIRALELYHTSGKTVTEQNRLSKQNPSPYDFYKIGLTFSDREILYERINNRVDEMFDAGLENEVKTLIDSGKLNFECNAFQAIGYKQFLPYFNGDASVCDVKEKIKMESRRYAKRQLTWFNRDKEIHWLMMDDVIKADFEIFFNNFKKSVEVFLYI